MVVVVVSGYTCLLLNALGWCFACFICVCFVIMVLRLNWFAWWWIIVVFRLLFSLRFGFCCEIACLLFCNE